MVKEFPKKYDILGNEIRPGVYVAATVRGYKNLAIFVVNRVTNKMVNISPVSMVANNNLPNWMIGPRNIFPSDLIVVDQEKALMYALKV